MTAAADDARPEARPAEPFVGLRPYERSEGQLFKGRDRDAQYLTNKVFASRLTLLYAPSGMGKSSLLRVRVLPALEAEGCRIAYHDAWSGDEPEAHLAATLHRLALADRLPDVLGDSAPLIDRVRLLSADGRTLVLVLDQFEEFLLNHAGRLDPLRAELATLARVPDLDLRIVLALREEFLADLEPFHELIANLFQSTYRLEALGDEDIEAAVRDPIEAYGRRCQPELPRQIVADLAAANAGTRRASGSGVDLPMLQVVCLEMWRAAVARGRTDLTLDFYRGELGGADAILDRYVRSKMPAGWRDRVFTARLMTHLAPPSGLKISYTASDLAAMTGEAEPRIERELQRLADPKIRIVRPRDYGRQVRYELQHDALIRRIAPWRDDCLARQRRWRLAGLGGAALLSVGLVLGGFELYDRWRLRQAADQPLANLACNGSGSAEARKEAAGSLDRVAALLVGHARAELAWDLLRDRMQRHVGCIAPEHGRSALDPYSLQRAPDTGRWPFVLSISGDRPFDEDAFLQVWLGVAGRLTERFGVPVPRRLRIERDPGLPLHRVRLLAGDDTLVDTDIGSPAAEAAQPPGLVRLDDASPLAQRFEARFESEWPQWKPAVAGQPMIEGRWRLVPRWSLPAWKALGVTVLEPGAGLGLVLENLLRREPQRLLAGAAPAQAARLALDGPGAASPASKWPQWSTVYAALPVLLAGPHGASQLALALDAARGLDDDVRDQALATFAAEGYVASLRHAARQPLARPAHFEAPVAPKMTPLPAYAEMQQWMPQPPPPLRVLLGPALARAWMPDGRTQPAWMLESIGRLREALYARRGIVVPDIAIGTAGANELPGPNAYKVALFDEDDAKLPALQLAGTEPQAFEELAQAVARRLDDSRAAWVTDTQVEAQLASLPAELRGWIAQRFDAPAPLLMARALLGSEAAATLAPAEAAGRSLRHLPWLMGGLAAWTVLDEGAERATVGDAGAFLRRLQQARGRMAAGAAAATAAGADDAAIAAAFADGRVAEGQRRLAAALQRADRGQVQARFVVAYAEQLRSRVVDRLRRSCRDVQNPEGEPAELRADLDEAIGAAGAQAPVLRLCAAMALPGERQGTRNAELAALAKSTRPADWPPEQARWIGEALLYGYDALRDPPEWARLAAEWFADGLARLPRDTADDALASLHNRCGEVEAAAALCWQAIDLAARRLADLPSPAIDLALALADLPALPGTRSAAEWSAEAERRVASAPLGREQRAHYALWSRYVRAYLRYKSLGPGDAAALKALDGELAALEKPAVAGLPRLLRIHLALEMLDDAPAAARLAQEALQQPQDRTATELLSLAMLAALRQGDAQALERELRRIEAAVDKADHEQRSELLLLSAVGRLMQGGDADWRSAGTRYLATGHTYVNVVAMLMHQRMEAGSERDEAGFFIQRRWSQVDRSSWPRRLAAGVPRAWYEMLLGAYLGQVDPQDILGPLATPETLAASPFAHLPYPLASLRADAHFYEALRAQRTGDRAAARQHLQQVIDLGQRENLEYHMARHLLAAR